MIKLTWPRAEAWRILRQYLDARATAGRLVIIEGAFPSDLRTFGANAADPAIRVSPSFSGVRNASSLGSD
jgi:hypothetical protein